MFALILDTLGSTELLFILIIALIFFGPRKLPQMAHKIGKSLAEFRRASEDFKHTWEREVALETARLESTAQELMSMEPVSDEGESLAAGENAVDPANNELVVARETSPQQFSEQTPSSSSDVTEKQTIAHSRKHEWL